VSEKSILIIDDSQVILQALPAKILSAFSVQALPLMERRTRADVQNYLQARLRSNPDGSKSLRLDDGSRAAVLGLNAHLACLSNRPGQRSLCYGIKLLEWLRTKHALLSPIVLWSFLDESALKLEAIDCPKEQIVYLPLPARSSSLQLSFEKAARSADMSGGVGSKNPIASSPGQTDRWPALLINQKPNFRRDFLTRLLDLKVGYESSAESLDFAIKALKQGSAGELCEFLASDSWRRFIKTAQEIEKMLLRAGIGFEEVSEVSKQTNHITGFQHQCNNGRAIEQLQLREWADHYFNCSIMLHDKLSILTALINTDSL
jgi:hypothetical protein